jgi:hypothetical protein
VASCKLGKIEAEVGDDGDDVLNPIVVSVIVRTDRWGRFLFLFLFDLCMKNAIILT